MLQHVARATPRPTWPRTCPTSCRANSTRRTGAQSLGRRRLSDGGTCASMLSLRNPTVFSTFGDYSGFLSPTYLERRRAADDPPALRRVEGELRGAQPDPPADDGHGTPPLAGWFSAGSSDTRVLQASPAARRLRGKRRRARAGVPHHAAREATPSSSGRGLQGLVAVDGVAARAHAAAGLGARTLGIRQCPDDECAD